MPLISERGEYYFLTHGLFPYRNSARGSREVGGGGGAGGGGGGGGGFEGGAITSSNFGITMSLSPVNTKL